MATSSAVQGIKTEAQKMWCCIFRGGNDSFSSLFKMNLIFWVLEKKPLSLFEWKQLLEVILNVKWVTTSWLPKFNLKTLERWGNEVVLSKCVLPIIEQLTQCLKITKKKSHIMILNKVFGVKIQMANFPNETQPFLD